MTTDVDVVVVGAGFAGLYMLHRLREAGLSARVLEAGSDVGGTWYWNRYPGARCDVESVEYSYQFSPELEQEWHWTERYAAQPEILAYARHVADRFDLRRDITFDTRVVSAGYDDASATWVVHTDTGTRLRSGAVVMATGCLSCANRPELPGAEQFAGDQYHTGEWPEGGVDFTGRRVGVIGTGSSAIQAVPVIAEQASELYVFQRTAAYSVPARNRPSTREEEAEVKARYPELRAANRQMTAGFGARDGWRPDSASAVSAEERDAEFARRWARGGLAFLGAFSDTLVSEEANEYAAEFVRARIREIVHDPAVAEALCPDQRIGCKRLCLDSGYYETFNRANVHLVDLRRNPIEAITAAGIVAGGREHPLDAIVYATGFDAMTGAVLRIDVRGRDGRSLAEAWAAGPVTYLGLAVPGFPNLFLITGPGSPSVLTNMIPSIEQHVEWITDCLAYARDRGKRAIEAAPEAADAWVAHVNAVASFTLYPSCNSWYLGANVPGKPRVFMPLPGFPAYVARCEGVAARGYEGFVLS